MLSRAACFVELGDQGCVSPPHRCKWALWAQKWQPWHAKHVASLLITCLGPCKQKIACRHAPPLVFFQKVMPQQQRMHSTKQTATTQEMQTRCWKQQTGPLKSDEQGHGGKKKSPNPFFWLSKNPCCQKKMAVRVSVFVHLLRIFCEDAPPLKTHEDIFVSKPFPWGRMKMCTTTTPCPHETMT